MLKRVNKITSLIVAATSIVSMVPVMAAEEHKGGIWDLQNYVSKTSTRLDAKDGSIENAVAFKDGIYLYDGYKGDNDSGMYLHNGTDEKLIESVSEFDSNPKFQDKYVLALDGSDQYKINLTDGTVSDDDIEEDLDSTAKTNLKTKLQKTNRYGHDVKIKTFNRMLDGEFDDNATWYEYTATGNLSKYDDILGVPKKLAAGLTFTDENAAEGKISGTVSITKAADESDIDSYKVYYLDKNDKKVGSAIGTVSKTASSLQVSIADTDIPTGATQIGVYSVNSKGESENATKIEIVDKGAAVATYKAQVKIEITAFWSNIAIAGKIFTPSWGSNLPDAIVQAVKNTTFDNYEVISAVSEHAFKEDGSVDINGGKVTIILGTNQELKSLPTNFVTFNNDPNSGALKVQLISDSAVPDKLATGLTFTDKDTAEGKISGTVSITKAADESNIDSYRIYYLNDSNEKIGAAIGTVDKGVDPLQVTIDDTDIPSGATQLGVYSVNANGESTNATKIALVDAKVDASIKTKIKVVITGLYSDLTIDGKKFSPAWGSNLSDSLAKVIKETKFDDYEIVSVLSEHAFKEDGSIDNNSGKVTLVLGTQQELASVPDKFITFYDSKTKEYRTPDSWEMTAEIIQGEGLVGEVEEVTTDAAVTVSTSKNENTNTSGTSDTNEVTDADKSETATTGAAVSVNSGETSGTDTPETSSAGTTETSSTSETATTSAAVNFEGVLGSEDTSDEVVYYGYTDGDGNYIDCSKIANISVFNGEKIVKIENFNDEVTKGNKTVKVGLPTLVRTIGEDSGNIYNVISVPVVGAQQVGKETALSENAKTTLYYLQKISKVKGNKEDEAYLPSKVESYSLNSTSGWNGGDNWSYMAAYDMLVGNYPSRKIKIIDGKIFVAHDVSDGKEVTFGKILLSKTKKITPMKTVDGKDVVDESKDEVMQPLVYEDSSNNTKMETWTMDHKGSVWALYKGKIKKSTQGNGFAEIYTCDDRINHIDVYDDDNLIAWSDDKDIYVTVSEGEMGKSVTKTGWHKLEDGTWHLYDVNGNQVKGWAIMGSGSYYMNDQGAMQTGWLKDKDKSYYLAESGMMKTGWVQDKGKWYYLDKTGVMQTGWVKIDGKWYYLDNLGVRQENTTIDGYQLDVNGVWVK